VPSACLVGSDLNGRLLLRSLAPLIVIIAVPTVGGALSAVQRLRRPSSSAPDDSMRSTLASAPKDRARRPKSLGDATRRGFYKCLPVSLVLTFCFTPSVSASIFRAWHCLVFAYSDGKEYSYLAEDLQVSCGDSPEHFSILTVAWPMVALWPIGSVVMYTALLIPIRSMLIDEKGSTPLLTATTFLHRDYKPIYYWWEVAALIQRTILTGWLRLVKSELKFLRLLSALIITIGFLVALLVCQPYRRRFDQMMAASCQIVFICTFLGGMLVLLFEDIDDYTGVPPGLASELLGLNSSEEVVVMMICVAFTMLVLLGLTAFADSYALILQKRLRSKWAVCTLDPPQVKNWHRREVYACFLSHYKMEAASEARYMHDTLRKMVKQPVYLDSSTLNDLRNLVSEGVHKSDALILLATKGVLSRPWCLIELLEAWRKRLPIIVVEIAGRGFNREEARDFMTTLETEMAAPALDLLFSIIGPDLTELKDACLQILNVDEEFLVLNPHAGDSELVAMMKDVVEKLAQRTKRQIKWVESSTSKRSRRKHSKHSRRFCALSGSCTSRTSQSMGGGATRCRQTSLLLEQSDLAGGLRQLARKHADGESSRGSSMSPCSRLGRSVKSVGKRLKTPMPDTITNRESAIFVCCSRSDAINHARVLRSELCARLDRGCAIGGGPSTVEWIERSEAVVVVLSKALVTDPIALFEIWTALRLDVPILTVAIAGKYDFEKAGAAFANLPLAMEKAAKKAEKIGELEAEKNKERDDSQSDSFSKRPMLNAIRHSAKRPGRSLRSESSEAEAAAQLIKRLPPKADVASIGKTIHESLTAIIAISWTPHYGRNHMDAIIDVIMARVIRDSRSRIRGSWIPFSRSSSRSDTNCGASERTPARKLTKSNSLNNLTAATRAAATPVAATPAAAKHAPLHAPLARAITLGSFRRGSITQLTTTTLTTFRRSSVTQLKGARSETLNKWKQASQL